MSDYLPIPCIEHEKLEYAVLRRQTLSLEFREEDGTVRALNVLPTDVATRNGAEWLSYRDQDGHDAVVRLDRIFSVQPVG